MRQPETTTAAATSLLQRKEISDPWTCAEMFLFLFSSSTTYRNLTRMKKHGQVICSDQPMLPFPSPLPRRRRQRKMKVSKKILGLWRILRMFHPPHPSRGVGCVSCVSFFRWDFIPKISITNYGNWVPSMQVTTYGTNLGSILPSL